MPEGMSLYVRGISKRRHGTPKQFAKKCADHRIKWVALAAIWQDVRNGRLVTRRMNSVDTVRAYGDALRARNIEVWAWGYPWMGAEEVFRDRMIEYVDPGLVLLDPEKGSNPDRARTGAGKKRANEHAKRLVALFAECSEIHELGLSTFGNGWRIGWFPLLAFTQALVRHFGGRTFIGGQTYTDDGVIDRSIADMMKVIEKAGGEVIRPHELPPRNGVEIVPNYGTYAWNTPSGKRTKGAKARSKRPDELRAHLYEFVNEQEPVDALIGWAENFMSAGLWKVVAEFAEMMERGACVLPPTPAK